MRLTRRELVEAAARELDIPVDVAAELGDDELYGIGIETVEPLDGSVRPKSDGAVNDETVERIVAFIRDHGTVTNEDVRGLLRSTTYTASRYLNALHKRGQVTRRLVKSKQAPSGVWVWGLA